MDHSVIHIDWISSCIEHVPSIVSLVRYQALQETGSPSFTITESRSLDLNSRICLQSLRPDFMANVFAFSITIRPYEKGPRISGLVLDVLRNVCFVGIDCDLYRRMKEFTRRRVIPVPVLLVEV